MASQEGIESAPDLSHLPEEERKQVLAVLQKARVSLFCLGQWTLTMQTAEERMSTLPHLSGASRYLGPHSHISKFEEMALGGGELIRGVDF